MADDDFYDDTTEKDEHDETEPPSPDWPDDVDAYPVVINVYNENGDEQGRYYTLVLEDDSFDDGYIVSDIVNSIAPDADHVATKIRPDDEDDEEE